MLPIAEETVFIEVKGDITKRLYKGEFVFKTSLSNLEMLEIAKATLRISGGLALPGGYAFFARAMADLDVMVLKAPKFWEDSAGGRSLEDPNLIEYLHGKAQQAITDYRKKLADEAERLEAANPPPEEKPAKKIAKKETA